MLFAKLSTAKAVTFGPVLAVDGTPYTGAIAYTDAKIFKNGTDGALDASATFTHKFQGIYALALTANDISALGTAEVILNLATYAASPVKLNVLPAATYDIFVTNGTIASATNITAAAGVTLTPTTGLGNQTANITGNLIGTVSTLTTYTGNTLQTGDSFARIGATGTGLTTLAPAATALSTATWTPTLATNLGTTNTLAAGATGFAAIDTVVDTILADTNELQSDWVNGGRLDSLLDGAASAGDPWTTALPGSYAAGTAGYVVGNQILGYVDVLPASWVVPPTAAQVVTAMGTGTFLTAIPWNAAWDAEVQSECTDALNAYDPPTNAEMEARTVTAATYATATALTTAQSTLTKLETTWVIDGAVYHFTANALELAPAGGAGAAPTVAEIRTEMETAAGKLGVLYADWLNEGRLDSILDAITGGAAVNITTTTTIIESE